MKKGSGLAKKEAFNECLPLFTRSDPALTAVWQMPKTCQKWANCCYTIITFGTPGCSQGVLLLMSHKISILLIVILLTSQVGVLVFNYYAYATRPQGEFYGSLPSGTDFILTPLTRPNVSTKALLSWATIAATATFTLDFVNYESNFNALKDYFTETGYQNFLNALEEANTLQTIQEKKLVISAVAIGPAVVSEEYEKSGIHNWKVEVPITVTYLSVSAEEKREKLISMTITQVPTTQASKGIGISKYVAIDLSPDIMG